MSCVRPSIVRYKATHTIVPPASNEWPLYMRNQANTQRSSRRDTAKQIEEGAPKSRLGCRTGRWGGKAEPS